MNVSKTVRRWLPLAAWVALIFAASSIPGRTTDSIDLPRGFDKLVHVVEYAVLAMLFYRGLAYGDPRARWSAAIIVVAVGALVAALDELYQSAVPGRDSSAADLVADMVGVLGGALAAVLHRRRRKRRGERS